MGAKWTRINELGNVYGQVTIIADAGQGGSQNKSKWLGKCECGSVKEYWGFKLRAGLVKSCGCWRKGNGRNPNALTEQEKIDRATKPRECSGCHKIKPPSAFSKIIRRRCVMCDKAREKERRGEGYHKFLRLKSFYRMTKEQYFELLESQNERCAICKLPPATGKELNVDHDHAKEKGDDGYWRGLLCSPCNMGLGHFKDDIERMSAAIEYLRFHKGSQNKSLTELE